MTTDTDLIARLLTCPFCGGPMEDRGYGAIHIDGAGCPLKDLAIDPEKWNRRALTTPPTDEALDALDDELRNGVIRTGEGPEGIEMFDVDDANGTMWDAADAITALRSQNAAKDARIAYLEGECVRLIDGSDREYNRKTNRMIERHAKQVDQLRADNERLRGVALPAALAVEELCQGQDPENQCWVVLHDLRAALQRKAGE